MTISLESVQKIKNEVESAKTPLTMFGTDSKIVELPPQQILDLKSILDSYTARTVIYLAAPYSDPLPEVRVLRFNLINQAASFLMRCGFHIYSPISHTHPIAIAGGLPTGWNFWEGYDTAVLSMCRAFVVLKLPGWDRSTGVAGETKIATQLHLPMYWSFVHELDKLTESLRQLGLGGPA